MTDQKSSKDIFWKEYEKLPDIIKDALFSEENFTVVSDICERHNLKDEESKSQLMKYVGKTLMGELPIKEFFINLELEMNLDTKRARDISNDIDRRIFSHLRIALNKLYNANVAEKDNLSDNKDKEKVAEKTPPAEINNTDPYKENLI